MAAARQRTVSDVGERRLIEMIRRAVERSRLGDIASLGDDAAILPPRRARGGREVVSTDVLIEGTHWRPHHLTPAALGRRALVVNLSDIAAMGARPQWFTIGLGMPPAQPVAWFRGLLRGLLRGAEEFGCPLVGGDLVRSPVATIAITVSGRCLARRPCRRDTARAGETLCVTSDLGRARLALEFLEASHPAEELPSAIMRRHRRPMPRLAEAAALATSGAVGAMIDVSDGLVTDLGWICRMSGVGAEVDLDALPIHAAVRRQLSARGVDAHPWAASSGEEFELLFTTRRSVDALHAAFRRRGLKTSITPIGRITARRGVRWLRSGKPVRLAPDEAYDHFAQGIGPGRTWGQGSQVHGTG